MRGFRALPALLLAMLPAAAAAPWDQGVSVVATPAVLPERVRVEAVNGILRTRLEELLPRLMRESQIDLWLVLAREYNEDPVYLTLVPEPAFAARRTTMLLFFDRGAGKGVERLVVGRYPIADLYEAAWEGGDLDEQWTRLAELVAERDPRRIGIDTSPHWPVADGLSAALRERLEQALPEALRSRLVPAEPLVVRWLETRTAAEIEIYPQIVALARSAISEAFSNRVITPGVTTTEDVAWFLRQRYTDLGLPIWFMPYVNVQRRGATYEPDQAFYGESDVVIQRGDVLHTDVGITYLRLNSDHQEMGYVLHVGEEDVPPGLQAALAAGNRWQDLLTGEFQAGRTGNEILAAARDAAAAAGLAASIYTHPLGYFGHAPGPTIGMWDNQGPTPFRGDWPLHPDTAYAIEGNVKVAVPEWDGQPVQIKLEQDAWFDGQRVIYLGGRQTRWHVVR